MVGPPTWVGVTLLVSFVLFMGAVLLDELFPAVDETTDVDERALASARRIIDIRNASIWAMTDAVRRLPPSRHRTSLFDDIDDW
jgi:hypothetical protein